MTTFLIILLIIIGIIAIVHFITDKNSLIVESITIDKPLQDVFDYIKFVKNHDNFNFWVLLDPNMNKNYKGTDGTVGFVYAWDSTMKKGPGAGEQEIKKITEGKSIDFELRFIRPQAAIAQSTMNTEAVSAHQTKVTWDMKSDFFFPGTLFKPMIEKMLHKNLADSLSNLKTVLEKL